MARERRHGVAWTNDKVEELKRLWAEGQSASQLAKRFGVTRSAVLGKVHRLGLSNTRKSAKANEEIEVEPAKETPAPLQKEVVAQKVPAGVSGQRSTVSPWDDESRAYLRQLADKARQESRLLGRKEALDALRAKFPTRVFLMVALVNVAKGEAVLLENTSTAVVSATDEENSQRVRELEDKAQKLTLMELTERTCKWPVGDPAGPTDDFFFCGLPTGHKADGTKSPYCDAHTSVAYIPNSARRTRRKQSNF